MYDYISAFLIGVLVGWQMSKEFVIVNRKEVE